MSMRDAYDPKGLIDLKTGNIYSSYNDPLGEKETTVFHIGQSYSNEPNGTIVCKICGGDKFYVGQGSHHTSIKCPTCEYEITIHDG